MPNPAYLARTVVLTLTIVILAAACARSDTAATDTSMSAMTSPNSDTGMAAMEGMSSTPARDADQELLRMMVDHHEGLIVIADSALRKGSEEVKTDAVEMRERQRTEQRTMISMLKSEYNDDKMAMMMPDNKSLLAAAASKTGSAYDRQFRET